MLLTPQSNVEKYLHIIAGHGGEVPSEPLSRAEYYLDEIVKGGGIGGKLKPEIVSALPTTGVTGLLYLIPSQGSGRNLCDEYFWIEDESRFELLGQTTVEVDLSGYVPNSRKVGGKSLANDIGITISGTGAIEVTDNGTSSAVVFDITHKDSGVTAGSKGDMTNRTPGFGETFKTLSVTVDTKGHVTTLTEHSVKIPDTKVTSSADGLMAKEDKAKLDKYTSEGSATKGVYIDASGSPQPMTHELNADVPVNFAPASAVPLMDGTAAVGTSAKYAREDHKHPTDTSRASAADVTAQGNRITALESENALLRELVNGIGAPVYRTAPEGNPVTFADGYPANVKALSVTITPAQSGSGDPSPDNIRPISGVSSVSVTRTGKNLLFNENDNVVSRNGLTYTRNADGSLSVTGTAETSTVGFHIYNFPAYYEGIHMFPPGTYAFSASGIDDDGIRVQFCVRTAAGVGLSYPAILNASRTSATVNVSGDWFSCYVRLIVVDGTVCNSTIYAQIESGSVVTDFEPCQPPVTLNVSLVDSNSDPLTVYGGTLNVTTGELAVTHRFITYDGSENWTYGGSGNSVYAAVHSYGLNGRYGLGKTNVVYGVCNMLPTKADGSIDGFSSTTVTAISSAVPHVISDFGTQTVEDWKAFLSANPLQVAYRLATPVTYQLTPAQLDTLSGYNTVTTDADALSVTYRADTALSLGGVT